MGGRESSAAGVSGMPFGLHPGTTLVGAGLLVLLLQSLPPGGLVLATAVLLAAAIATARCRTLSLVRRTRWLLLSIVVLFSFATPGERLDGLPGDLGLTRDGLMLAFDHILRLVLMLATLAILHERLGTGGLMVGLHWLLAPLARLRSLRDRIVVRLMLVLEYAESSAPRPWRDWLAAEAPGGEETRSLEVRAARGRDWTMLAVFLGAASAGAWLR